VQETEQDKSESSIQVEILDWLNKVGVFAFRVNSAGIYDARSGIYRRPSKYFMKGQSDIMGCLPCGRMMAIECKAISGRLSPEQAAFLDKMTRQGAVAFVAKSVYEVQEQLKEHGYGLDKWGKIERFARDDSRAMVIVEKEGPWQL
jgi:hypothetical protein